MKRIILVLMIFLLALGVFAQKIEKTDDVTYTITGDHYVAMTNGYNGGYMQSFKVDGVEFEEGRVDNTRGNYLLNGSNMTIGKPATPVLEGNKLTLTSELGTMVYEFYPDRVEISSFGNAGTGCYFIIDGTAKWCKIGNEYKRAPLGSSEPVEHIWLKGRAGLKTSGDVTYWGPWNNAQVVDYSIAEGITKKLVLTPYTLTEEDLAVVLDNPLDKEFMLYSPKNYMVVQRQTKSKGYITINGLLNKGGKDLSYRFTGKDYTNKSVDTKWQKIKLNKR